MTVPHPPYLGAAYYPEGLSDERIEQDIQQMRETGINVVRLAEFAWSRLEPVEGQFDFAWLRRVIDKLSSVGIAVILCTPSATPPIWLTDKYPEILPLSSDGYRTTHGARLHYCPNNTVYRFYVKRICREMAKAFFDIPTIIGWQIDNEVYIPLKQGCFCDRCRESFRRFLKQRFGNIDALNKAWQLSLWSQEYQDFSQIPLPRSDVWHHPSLKTAWLEFQEESVIDYVEDQISVLKEYIHVPIGTDMMPMPFIGHAKANRKTDVVMFNHYNTEEDIQEIFFWFDYLKTIKDTPLWNTETDPCGSGSIRLQRYKPRGFCTVNSWLPWLFGGEANMYWHWRGHRAGQELMHGTIIDTYGRPTYTYGEIQRLAKNLHKCSEFLNGTKLKPAKVAIHYSALAEKMLLNQTLAEELHYRFSLRDKFYQPLLEAGIRVDVIAPGHDLSGYDVVISPFLPCLDEEDLRERLEEWIQNGGTWIAGPLADIRDANGAKMNTPYSCLEEWGGVYRKYFVSSNPRYPFSLDNGRTTGQIWYDGYELKGACAKATYDSDAFELADLVAIAENRKGAGRIVVMGTVPQADYFVNLITHYMKSETPDFTSSDNVLCVPRKGRVGEGLILAEYRHTPGTLSLNRKATDLLTGITYSGEVYIAPYDVMVLMYV